MPSFFIAFQNLSIILLAYSAIVAAVDTAFGFRSRREPSTWGRNRRRSPRHERRLVGNNYVTKHILLQDATIISTNLGMVRNVDLPEALVFYGLESIMEPSVLIGDSRHNSQRQNVTKTFGNNEDDGVDEKGHIQWKLRSGVARLLNECLEVRTAALLLSEVPGDDEEHMKQTFQRAWIHTFLKSSMESSKKMSTSFGRGNLETLLEGDNPVLSFRCLQSTFVPPANSNDSSEDENIIDNPFYNLHVHGRSPSPAFLLDTLHSIHLEPRGLGGSSGVGRGQWVEPRSEFFQVIMFAVR